MQMRLQKALAQAGVASRRKAEELIVAGRVEVNGQVVRELGTQVDPEKDLIRVSGKLLEKEQKVYFVFFKPPGVVTTLSDPQGRPTVGDYLRGIRERVFAVGRLDFDAEGALIVTNDGELANRLMHPRYEVPRVYLAKVKGVPDAQTLEMLRSGVRLEDGTVRPAEVEVGSHAERNTWLKLVLTEGRPHLVKRLCAAIGHPVVRLYRPMYGGVSAEGLAPGQFRPLTPVEITKLQRGGEGAIPRVADLKPPPRRHRAAESEGAEFEEAPAREPTPRVGRVSRGESGGRTSRDGGRDRRPEGRSFGAGKSSGSERMGGARGSRSSERSAEPRSGRGSSGGRSSGGSRERSFESEGREARSGGRFVGGAGRSDRSERPGGSRGRSSGGERSAEPRSGRGPSGGRSSSGSRERSFESEARSGGRFVGGAGRAERSDRSGGPRGRSAGEGFGEPRSGRGSASGRSASGPSKRSFGTAGEARSGGRYAGGTGRSERSGGSRAGAGRGSAGGRGERSAGGPGRGGRSTGGSRQGTAGKQARPGAPRKGRRG